MPAMFKIIPTLSQETRTPIDTDGDGTPDRFEVDTDGDGTPDRIEFDPDQDGNIDRIAHLDEAGRWVQVDMDLDDDGTIDRITHYAFDDEDGTRRVTRREVDLDDDGTIDRSETYIYDDDGNRTRINFDLDDDGNIDRTARLNAEGRGERVELDVDDDGTIDRITHYAFDEDGNRRVTRREVDLDDDGTIDRSEAYIYDNAGNRTRINFDLDDDGNIDRTARLNAEGRGERVELDVDDDGTIDRITHFAFDEDGTRRVTRRDADLDDDGNIDRTIHLNAEGRGERVERDLDDDGTIDRITHFAFDEDGNRRVTRRDVDLDDDGNIDRTIHLNAEGRWERVEWDDDDDGTIDRTVHRNTDGSNTLNRTDFDDDGDGTTDRSEFYTQNADGNRDRANFDDDADGTIDRSETYTYDDDGNLSQTNFDDDNDGTTDRSEFDDDADGNIDRVNVTENRITAYRAPDADGDTLVYSLSGTDAALFTIDAATGEVSFMAAPDFEAPGDANGDNIYDIIVTASDGTTDTEQAVAITVTNENDNAPTFTSPATANARENQTAAYEAAATDADGDTLVYSLSGTDAALFTIDADTGEVSFIAAPDFEAPGDANGDNVYDIIVTASDGATDTEQAVAITVTSENGNIPVFTSPAAANAQENQTVAYMATATDADGDTLVYSLSGTDAALFTIDATTGEVSFMAAPDFEAPGDANGDNVYDIIVTASDGATDTEQAVAITVTNDNDNIPVFTSPATANAQENQTAAYMAAATDADGDTLVYSLSGTDAALFTIDATTGEVSFMAAPDFEAPGDANGDNVYDIIVTASDGATDTEQAVAITVTNDNDNAPTFTSPATANAQENQTAAYMAAATDADGDTLAYSLSGTDSALFTIDAATGEVSFMAAPDFEAPGDANGDNIYDIIVTASDGTTDTEQAVAITVTNENDNAPTFTSPATANAQENQTVAYEAAATDADGDTLVYSLSGTDAALFTIDANTGEVSFMAAPDFEAPGDANGDNVYDIIVTASDGINSTNHNVAITVTNDNDNIPVFTSPATANAQENQTVAYMAAATDADGDTLVYSLSGTDAALFTIDTDTGEVSFIEAPDFEAPGDDGGDNIYDIIVTASDGINSTDHNVAITVTNDNDNIPVFTSPATANAQENQTVAYEAAATDADGDTLVYSLSGTDAALFTIDANTGEVSFMAAPDFEAPGDANGDNVYDIIVIASDGINSTDHNVAITVTNENDNAPTFTSPATANAQENQTAAYMAAATDADGDTLVYSLSGTDSALFTIDAATGEVSFMAAPDFEAPGDANGDNIYDIIVTASDGTTDTEQAVAITVTSENGNAPTFTSPATANAQENQTAAYMAAATDADGDTLVYSLSGTDAALFTIDATTGEVSFMAAPDFEAPGDANGDNIYDIIVTASDGTNSTNHNVAITVTNDNDNIPVFTSPATANAQENQTAAYMAAATDADGDTLVYSLSGTDAALFTIDANTGEVSFMAAPDFEAPGDANGDNVYDIIVTASDGTNSTDHNVAITVTNDNDNIPVFTSPATANAQENQTVAYMAAATDADGDTLVYSLSGTDAALFTIDAATGEVSFIAAPDFEAPGDDGGDNVYDIIVTASDGTNSTNHNVAITVTNDNDNIPVFTSPATANAQENQTVAYMAAATDTDGDTLVYSLSGTDAALFTIDAATGEVSFIEAPDFEAPGDDGGDNIYDIIVTASDGINSTDHNVAITVTNDNDNAPTFTSPATANAQENQTAAYMVAATDADGDTLVYSLSGTDAALFTIDADTGEVSFIAAPDFEAPGDDGGDNVYDIIVTASDGTTDTEQAVAITVTNENDNAPTFTSPAAVSVAENQTAAYMAAATDADGDTLVYSLSGTDAALFTIDTATGEVSFIEAPDFEAPGDDGGDNIYDIIVTASDGINSTDHNVAITVTNDNDNIPVFTSPATANAQENQTVAYEAAATDADGDTLVYSLSGTDAALFTIDANTGEVSFMAAPDFEAPGDDGGDNIYDIIVTASDGINSTDHNVAITVTNENDNAPTFTSPATANAQENQTVAYMAAATDADGDTLVYSLSGTDSALFTIDTDTGEVSFIEAPDFEAPGDDGGDNIYDIIVTASDGINSTDHNVAITVTNDNDNIPVFTSPATANAQENQTVAYEAAATDADGDTLVYSLSGTDSALFTIDAATGEVSFMAAPDFEAPGDANGDNIYDIIVTASDGTTDTEQTVAITVTSENGNAPTFTSPATANAQENQTVAYMAAATDADGDTLVYSLSGTDAALFTIDANTGEVSFMAAPDFEAPGDANGDNVYDIIVTASDGINSTDHNVAITVTNDNDNAPTFTSPATANAQENQTAAYMAAATDADGDTLVYSLSGTDSALFTIDAATGEVSFMAAPDFEAPGDANGDNIYDIIVTASDGTNSTDHNVAITVTNENDNAPTFTSPAAVSVAENQTVAYEAAATDADGDTLVYSLSGTDAALFTIDAATGEVSFMAAPDFEAPGDDGGDNIYDIIVTASDGINSTDHNVAITVTNDNDNAPVFTSPATANAQENQTVAYMATATDADGDALVYSLSGTDSALFTIDADTGEVSFMAAPDFEAPGDDGGDNIYDIIVTASDGINSTDHNVAITVTNDNDNAPVFTSPATANAQENQTVAYMATATDADGDALVYSLSGTDSALFTIDADTGEVSFMAAPDFEAPGDANGDNIYDIIVIASDGTTDTEQAVAITVTSENGNVPVFTSPAAVSVAENQTAAYMAAATDADGDTLVYSLSGTDSALFTIDATTGEVSFIAAPDFEAPGDDGGDNVYDIIVTASDGTTDTEQAVAITVTDVNELVPLSSLDLSSLDGTNGFILNGIDRTDQSGRSVSSAGDVNGDGYDDLIIGAPGGDPNGDSSGETYLVYGGASAPGTDGVLDLSRLALDGNGFTLAGIDAGDISGQSVSSAGDVNGDGYDDLIIGAFGVGAVQGEYDTTPGPGEAYVVYGGATGADLVLDRSTLDGTRGFALTGIDVGDRSGFSVSSAGDVNGDGYDDLIIGAYSADPNGNSSGETYIVYGGANAPGTDGVLDLSALDGSNGFTLTGIDEYDNSGRSVSSAGDVNGDGYDDLIIGAAGATPNGVSRAGETYIIYGGASAPGTDGVLDLSALDGTNGFILNGIDAADESGWSVSSAGDVNGDGYDDLIIGARDADPNGNSDAGETYIVYGGASAPGIGGRFNLSTLNGSNGFTLTGIDGDDQSGSSVSSAGDVNGDGYDDLIIGASGADPDGDSNAGETYIVYGGASAPGTGGVLDLSDLDGTNGFILTGIDAGDLSGLSVSSAGDVNGDGYDDLIIGARYGDPNGNRNAGETYVIYGGATGTESLTPVTASGTAAADNFTGNAGADSFIAIATNDVVRGGAGDDMISVTALDFAAIDGGTGQDILVLDGAGLALDLTGAGHAGVDSVEVFDLSGTGANSLVLDAQAVFDITEERAGGVASLDVLGDADDRVDLSGSSFALTGTAAEDGVTYNIYRDGNTQLRIENGVQIQIPGTTTLPTFTSPATANAQENQTAAYMAAATDADGNALVYSLSGTDAALFTIDAATGEVSFIEAPDFEAPGDDGGDNVYDIIVTASDGINSTDHNVAITVTNENDNAPTFTSPATANAQENQTAAYMAAATDADGDTLVYSLSGTDAALFTIDAATGEVSFIAAPDFEAPGDANGDNVYDIIVTASDGTTDTEQAVAITVTDENDNAPTFTSPAAANAQENQTAAYMAAATDADGNALVYSLSGTDAALFTIDAATGEVSFIAAPDFEAPGDDGGDNVYDIIVTASDGTNSTDHNVAITVTNDNDNAPTFTSPATANAQENQTSAYMASATDADGDTLVYSLSGTDAALFTIDADTGEVSFMAAPDFEAPGDANGDNIYDIIVTASDGTNSTDHNVAITVTNENDNIPVFTSPATANAQENQTVAYEAAATDADGDTLVYSLSGTDAALFTIDAATGEVSFIAAPDFEAPGDANGDNIYDIIVTASDGTNRTNHNVAITVTDVSEVDNTYDENGTLIQSDFDDDGDGTADRSESYTYDESGNLVRTDFDDDADGTTDRSDFDDDGDGTADRSESYTYDANDRVSQASFDDDADGTIDRSESYTYDANDRVSQASFDDDGDGTTDRSEAYEYNLSGRLSQASFDDDNDGTTDRSESYTYDANGNLSRTSFDDDADSTNDRIESYSYDLNGNLSRTEFDNNADGIIERAENYDLNGNLIRTEIDTDNDGVLDRIEIDLNNDGNPERVEIRNPSGQLVREEIDNLSDGTPNRVNYYWYPEDLDGDRDPFRQDDDTDGDGDLDRVSYEGDADFAGDFPNHAGLEVVRLGFVGRGDGFTTLTIPDGFVFAGASGSQVRIEGGSTDTLRFDMDDFTEGDRVIIEGQDYRSFAANDGSWSFLVDADVTLIDPTPNFTSPAAASVAENQTAAYMAVATDADGDTLVYSLSGTDSALFTIDAATGEVSFIEAPDFEAPGDDGGDNVYDIIVTASDGTNSTDHNVAITVTNDNDNIPVFTSPATANAQENQTVAYEAAATDADGDTLVYSLSGTDAALFTIDANTGEVSFIAAPDFEAPGDANGDNIYDIIVTASDGTNRTNHNVAITVTDVSEVDNTYDENGTLIQSDFDDDGDGTADRSESYTYDESGNLVRTDFDDDADGTTDRSDFDDDGDGTADRSESYTYDANDRVSQASFDDDADGTIDRSESYTYDANDRVSQASFDDDGDGTTDRSEAYEYNLSGRLSQASFDDDNDGTTDRSESYTYDANGNLSRTSFDDDADSTNDRIESYSYDLNGNLSRTEFDNNADGIIERAENYDLNGNLIRTEIDTDNDGVLDRIEIDLNNDGNPERVEIRNPSGQLVREEIDNLSDGTPNRVNYYWYPEDLDGDRDPFRQDDDTDGDGDLDRVSYEGDADFAGDFPNHAGLEVVRLGFVGRGDGFTTLTIPDGFVFAGASGSQVRIEGGSTDTLRFDMDDFTEGDRVIIEGQDYRSFAANDGSWSFLVDADVTLIDPTPTFTSPTAASVAENQTAAYMAAATDADGDTLVYSLSGTDAALFTIDADTGEVSFIEAPDFEAPGDDGGDNVYDIIVTASDGTNSTDHNVAITVTNDNDNAPTFTSPATANAQENQTAAYMAAATDADGDTLVYSLSGTDAALFTIDADTGEVSFIAAPDFEAPGDANGDNVYDIIVTASDGATDTEQAVAITVTSENGNAPTFTSPATANARENQTAAYMAAATDADGDTLVYSLSGTDAALFTIDAATGEVSFRAAPDFEAPGDANGDNVYDIIVTASDGATDTEQAVAITVTDEYDLIPLSSLDGSNGFILNGIDRNDFSGFSVSSAGDVNGDGYDDLIIGAFGADPNGDSEAGETYIVYGGASAPGTDGVLDLSALDGSNGFILTGIDAADQSGFSVSSAGDVNGDGYDDLVIGARSADPNGSNSGETYVVYGGASAPGTGGVLNLGALDGSNGFILNGIDANDASGRSVSSAGDVNGDGYDDLIIGAFEADPNGDSEAGETYIVYGGASAPGTDGVLDLSALDGSNGFILTGIDAGDRSGFSVSSAGDVNGDGYDDLIIGAREADPNEDSNAGETYVVYGGASAPGTGGELDLSALDGTNGFILNGIDAFDRSGFSVSSAGDVNGDGYDDLIIGAYGGDPNGDSSAGETYVVYGGASAPGTGGVLDLSDLDGSNGFILNGIDAFDFSGVSVSSAGDVNGDGYDDLIIGAWGGDPNGDSNAGETYVVYGGASAPGTGGVLDMSDLDGTNGFILTGIDAGDQSGSSVSSAGDVNGDGYDDLIIGARYADPNGDSNAGETYVIYGGATGTESLTPVTAQGMAAADNFTGNAGNDSFTAIATNDVVRGGAGDDTISVTALDFAAIDGGTGADRLVLDGAGLSLDLTGAGNASVDSVEVFDLSGTGANSLVLDALAVFDVTEEREGGVASLDVLGDADDRVDLSGSSFALTGTATEDGVTYNVYRDGNAQLRVETGVQVQIPVTATLPVFTSPAAANAQENQTAAYMAVATDADGDTLVYSLSGTDAALFTIDADTGEVSFRAAPDFEAPGDDGGDNVYDIIVTASDGTNSTDHNVAITVTNDNDNAPTFTSPAAANARENQTAAYMAAATDADGDTLVYGLSGTDAALFTIDANTGEVSFMAAPDFEAPGDANGDNIYDIIVTASDGTNSTDHNVAITVTNDNDNAPTFTSPATANAQENQTVAYMAAATDADGDTLVYSLSGTDAALFTIDANTGEVSFIAAPDFEAPGDANGDNIYDIIVTASDGTNRTDHNVAITVTNDNDNAPTFTSPATANAQENQTAAYMAAATDADGDTLVYSLSGTDAALFTIDADTGEVSFIEAPDFEAPGDDGGDNVYDIIVTASDGTTDTEQAVAITVTNENDNAPTFTSPAAANARENQTAAYMAAATDADGDTLVYGLSGTDAALFTIDANTGEVSFMAAPDFEAPGDANGDNIYDIIVTASDGTNSTDHNVAITVTNDNDNVPTFTSPATANAQENQTVAYMAAATDADGDTLVYSLSGTDSALFTIDANTGEVSFIAAPDFEAPGDANGDNIYDIIVTASDGTTDTEQAVAITVTSENGNAPTFTSPAAVSVAENQTAAYMAAATDADGDTLVYSLSGTDAALFTIDADTGEVSFMAAPDFEAPGDDGGDNVYDIIVTASDGTTDTEQAVAITVTNVNELVPLSSLDLSSLDGTNGFILNGIDRIDQSGRSVSSAGDVNGDGYDDLIIGAPGGDPNGDSSGETYLVYGGASAPGTDGVLDLSRLALDGNGFTLAGIDELDNAGISVSSAGDVNGDGYDDLIIGAFGVGAVQEGEYDTTPGPGEAYVVYGGATGADLVLDRSTLDGTRGFALTGIDAGDELGVSVSSAGDVNGDGYDDLIIGANGADNLAGETYIVYGGASAPGTGGVLDLSALDGTNGFILNGIDRFDQSGFSVSSAGDVNGDGYDDLIIGARFADPNGNRNAGETYIIYGGASAPGEDGELDLSALDGTNGFILTGIDIFDNSGVSVSSAGDINGDGYDDLIIGAPFADPNGGDSGETYIVYGGASAPGTGGVLNLSALDGTNGFILNGIDAADESGSSVSSAGDVNGDGYDDLIIGASGADPDGDSNAGETYIVYGGASAPGTGGVLDLSDLDGTNGFILTGIDAGDLSGRSVSSAGDVNGDGYDDLIIGARYGDPDGDMNAGETYVIYGGATGTESLTPVTAQGTAAVDNFTGNAGADSFIAIATNDVVRGGAGDDMISVTALDFAAIDGGTGQDTLVLDGAGLALDLTGAGHAGVDSVELFDLSGTGANSLVLDAQAVFDITEERAGGVASLDVLGDADDRVDLGGGNFILTGTATEDGVTYNIYRDGNAQLRIEDGVSVTLAAAGGAAQSAQFKTDTGIDPVADLRTDLGFGTIRLDGALINPDPLMNSDLWNNDLWDDLWADEVKSLDQPVHMDEDAILIPLSDPLSFGSLASGPLPGPWGDLLYWPGLGNHPAMQNDLAMILPEMEIVTANMEDF